MYTKPTFRYYSSNQDKARFLTANVEEDIAQSTAKMTNMKEQMTLLQRQRSDLDKEIRKNQMEERKMETHLMKIQDSKRRVDAVGFRIP